MLDGCYGLGNGQWMRNWGERVEEPWVTVSLDLVIINYSLGGDNETECINYGKQIAKV